LPAFRGLSASQLALQPARAWPERGVQPGRAFDLSLHAAFFPPQRFIAPGGACKPCRSRLTPDGGLLLPRSDAPLAKDAAADSTRPAYRVSVPPSIERSVRPLNSLALPDLHQEGRDPRSRPVTARVIRPPRISPGSPLPSGVSPPRDRCAQPGQNPRSLPLQKAR
jgi:hypothetical protein